MENINPRYLFYLFVNFSSCIYLSQQNIPKKNGMGKIVSYWGHETEK